MEKNPARNRPPFVAEFAAGKDDFMPVAASLLEDRLQNSTDRVVMKSPRLPPEGFRIYEAQEQHFELLQRAGNAQCRPKKRRISPI